MNRIPFTAAPDFQLEATTLEELQKQGREELQKAIVALVDQNAILAGVDNTGPNAYSDGIVVINGEILPFTGGTGGYLQVMEQEERFTYPEGEYSILVKRWTQTSTTSTDIVIGNLKRINFNQVVGKEKRVEGHQYISFNNDYALASSNELSYRLTSSGYATIKGQVRCKSFSATIGTWITLYTMISDQELLNPYTPAGFPDVYFRGEYEDSNQSVLFRLTSSGDLQMRIDQQPLAGNIAINVMYYNPQNL